MRKPNNKGSKEKYSIQNPSPRLLKTLEQIQLNQGGAINYVFVEERTEFTKKFPKGRIIKLKSTTAAPINSAMFYKEVRGKLYKRTYQEILQVFEDTRDDLGAAYFVIS